MKCAVLCLPAFMLLVGCTSAPDDEHAHEPRPQPGAAAVSDVLPRDTNLLTFAPDMLRDLRVTTASAEARSSGDGVTALGELRVNEDAYAEIRTAVPGQVTKILVGVGDVVTADQPMLELSSVEVGKALADYVRDRARAQLTAATLERKRGLAAERVVPARELQEAEAEARAAAADLAAAEASLTVLGIVPGQVGTAEPRFTLRTPIAGTVVERAVVRGQMVDPTDTLVRVATLSKLWVVAHVFERDAVRVGIGAPATASFPALPGRAYPGIITLVGQEVDASSRTIPVRIEVANDGLLKPGMSASAWIPLGETADGIVAVPAAAVQRCETGWCVFIPRGVGTFEVRPVGRGRDLGGEIEVVNGLEAGETVVADGAFLLRAERERSKGEGEHHDH